MDVINSKGTIRAAGETFLSVEPENLPPSFSGRFDSAGLIGNAQALREFVRLHVEGFAMQVAAARLTSRRILILRKRGCEIFIQDAGKIRFPTLREDVRAAIEHQNVRGQRKARYLLR
jgi:hypothetical protein